MDTLFKLSDLVEKKISDRSLARLIEFGLARQLKDLNALAFEEHLERKMAFVKMLKASPIAVEEKAANEQHYEVPAEFFHQVLGSHRKYSSCYWDATTGTLDDAESLMLSKVLSRSQVKDGSKILELGCGWGALSLYLAEKLPHAEITAISYSKGQKDYIEQLAQDRGLRNVRIITHNVVTLELQETFDTVISIEMFEHMRNFEQLLEKVSRWLKPQSKLFVHIFTHARHAYLFEGNWTADNFFTGGMMPSEDLLLYFQKDFLIQDMWRLDGTHYEKTAYAWLQNLYAREKEIRDIFTLCYGSEKTDEVFQMWRLFFLVTAVSFGFAQGQEWGITHYLFERRV
jgi:cyclopropane-fatty-acyl-phospholipid synthase